VQTEQPRDGQRLSAARAPRGRDQDALLHRDVAQDARAELAVGVAVDTIARRRRPQERVEAPVVAHEERGERSAHPPPRSDSTPARILFAQRRTSEGVARAACRAGRYIASAAARASTAIEVANAAGSSALVS